VTQGWNTADSDPSRARTLFGEALEKQPGHHEANYGYGYALLKMGKADDAKSYLCRAKSSRDIDIQREVSGLLERNGLSCD
jgi:predicted Zn-dependent protease